MFAFLFDLQTVSGLYVTPWTEESEKKKKENPVANSNRYILHQALRPIVCSVLQLGEKKKTQLGLYSFPCSEVLVSVEVCWINLPK